MTSLNEKVHSKEVLPERELSEEVRSIDKKLAGYLNELEYQLTKKYDVRIDRTLRELAYKLNELTKKEYKNRVRIYLDEIMGPIKDMIAWFNRYDKEPPRLAPLYFNNLLYNPVR